MKLREHCANDWEQRFSNQDACTAWETFKLFVQEVEEECVPKKRRRVASRPLWMQQNVIRTIREKRRLWRTYKRTSNYQDYLAYKKLEKEVRSTVYHAKRKFERNLAAEAKKKPKQFYSYIKSRMANRSTIGPLKDGDNVISDNKGMSSLLNSFFASVFTKETFPVPDLPTFSDVALSDVEITPEIVQLKTLLRVLTP